MSVFYYGSELLFFTLQAWFVLQLAEGMFSSFRQGRRKYVGQALVIAFGATVRLCGELANSFLLSNVMLIIGILITLGGTVILYQCSILDAFCLNILGWGSLILGDYLSRALLSLSGDHVGARRDIMLSVDAVGGFYFLGWAAGMIPAGIALNRWIASRKWELVKYRVPCLALMIPMLLAILCLQTFPGETRGQWAEFLLCCFLLFLVGLMVIVKQETDFSLKMQQQKSSMQEQQYKQLLAAYHDRMILVHDMKNHMRTIGAMLRQEKTEDAAVYVSQLAETLTAGKDIVWSNHDTMDLVLNMKLKEARSAQIRVDCHCDDMSGLKLSFVEVCALFSNLLDNAVEAARKCPTEERWINLQCARRERMLMVSISNSIQAGKTPLGKLPFKTAKIDKDLHGFGMHSIQKVLDSHGGNMRTNVNDGGFCVVIYLVAFGEKEVSDEL